MSVEAMAICLHHSKAKGTARLVLLGIANHDGDGGAWPTNYTLCKYAGGVDERNVRRALKTLIGLGEVIVLPQQGGDAECPDDLRPNLYRITLRCPSDCDRTTRHLTDRDRERQARLRLMRRGDRGANTPPGDDSAPGPGGATAPGPGGASAPQTIPVTIPRKRAAVQTSRTDARGETEGQRRARLLAERRRSALAAAADPEAVAAHAAACRAALRAKASS